MNRMLLLGVLASIATWACTLVFVAGAINGSHSLLKAGIVTGLISIGIDGLLIYRKVASRV